MTNNDLLGLLKITTVISLDAELSKLSEKDKEEACTYLLKHSVESSLLSNCNDLAIIKLFDTIFPAKSRREIVTYFFNHEALFNTFCTGGSLKEFVKLCRGDYATPPYNDLELETTLFEKFMTQCFTKEVKEYGNLAFNRSFEIFVHNGLPINVQKARIGILFQALLETPSFNSVIPSIDKDYDKQTFYTLEKLVSNNPHARDLILTWAVDNRKITDKVREQIIYSLENPIKNPSLSLDCSPFDAKYYKPTNYDSNQTSKLHQLADKNEPAETIKNEAIALLKNGADLEETDEFKRTPLCVAAYKGKFLLVLTLLSYGAKVNVEDIRGYSPRLYVPYYYMDNQGMMPMHSSWDLPWRALLETLYRLEVKHSDKETSKFSFAAIKKEVGKIMKLSSEPGLDYSFLKDERKTAIRQALCGYIFNRVPENEKEETLTMLIAICRLYGTTLDHDTMFPSIPSNYFKVKPAANPNVFFPDTKQPVTTVAQPQTPQFR